MSTKIQSNGSFTVETNAGDKPTFTFNTAGDFIMDNPARKSSGRALVANVEDVLVINFAKDFAGGVHIDGLSRLVNLKTAPAGVNTFDIVVDKDGNVYKKD